MNIKYKILTVIVLIILILAFPIESRATEGIGTIIKKGDDFISDGKDGKIVSEDTIKSGLTSAYNVLFGLGVILSVVVGLVLGIKFVLGSIEEQAKVKEMLIPYVLGCVVIFGAFGIWKLAVTILSSIN